MRMFLFFVFQFLFFLSLGGAFMKPAIAKSSYCQYLQLFMYITCDNMQNAPHFFDERIYPEKTRLRQKCLPSFPCVKKVKCFCKRVALYLEVTVNLFGQNFALVKTCKKTKVLLACNSLATFCMWFRDCSWEFSAFSSSS